MAQVILPIGLPPGTQYQLIFATKDTWSTPTDGNIADYNTFVTTEANQSSQLAALGVQWNAIVSTTTENASANAPSSGLVYNTDGTEVASAASALYSGGLLAAENGYDQFGATDGPRTEYLWTGSTPTGGAKTGYTFGNVEVEYGNTGSSSGTWLDTGSHGSVLAYDIYALSTPITVVPEPTTITLVAVGLLGAWAIRRRKA